MNILPYISYVTGKSDGVIITFVDITARVTDFKEQQKLITDHESLLDTISHDVNSALTKVLLAVSRLATISPEDQQGAASCWPWQIVRCWR